MGIIPGPKEARDTNAYTDVLVDEVLYLNGLPVYDALKKESFDPKVDILLNISTILGQNKVLKGQGGLAFYNTPRYIMYFHCFQYNF